MQLFGKVHLMMRMRTMMMMMRIINLYRLKRALEYLMRYWAEYSNSKNLIVCAALIDSWHACVTNDDINSPKVA